MLTIWFRAKLQRLNLDEIIAVIRQLTEFSEEVCLVTILKIILITVSLVFTIFGYQIYFQKKYKLINGFEADFKAGRKTEEYAKKVGLV